MKLLSVHDVIQQLRDGRAKPLSMVVEGDNMPALLVDIARDCTRIVPEQRPTFAELSKRLSAPSLVRTICFERWLLVEEEEDVLVAHRPLVRLSVPTTLIKEPSAVVGSDSGDGRLATSAVVGSASGPVTSISKTKTMDHNACVIS
jgi:hypothetical protein